MKFDEYIKEAGIEYETYMTKEGDEETIVFKAVDGTKVRDKGGKQLDFTEGGHHYVYPDFIKNENEIWIDYSEAQKDSFCIALHEFVERMMMKYFKMEYEDAHDNFANTVEEAFRNAMKKAGYMK